MISSFLILVLAAKAQLPPPDYRQELVNMAAGKVEAMNTEGRYAQAVEWGSEFQRQVLAAADIAYEVAYAWNALGESTRAVKHYRQALQLDPGHAASWYDLGELLLVAGEADEAQEAFQQAAELRADHWAGHFRLAEIAARRGQPEAFEAHLRQALRTGFSFRIIVGDSHWQGYYREPALRDVLRRLVTVYSDEALLEAFETQDGSP